MSNLKVSLPTWASNEHDNVLRLLVSSAPKHIRLEYALRMRFKASNNKTEHENLIARLKLAKTIEVHKFMILYDSQLAVKQVNGEFQAKGKKIMACLNISRALVKRRVPNYSNIEVKK